jgi:hypothetical protein
MPWKLPWDRQTTPSEPPQNAQAPAVEPPGSLEARVSHLTAELAALRLEWSETLDKLGRWASRQSARDRRRVDRDLDALGSDDPSTHEDAPGATIAGGADSGSLSDRSALKAALRRRIHNGA